MGFNFFKAHTTGLNILDNSGKESETNTEIETNTKTVTEKEIDLKNTDYDKIVTNIFNAKKNHDMHNDDTTLNSYFDAVSEFIKIRGSTDAKTLVEKAKTNPALKEYVVAYFKAQIENILKCQSHVIMS